jgi:hypothetical protein
LCLEPEGKSKTYVDEAGMADLGWNLKVQMPWETLNDSEEDGNWLVWKTD